MSETAMTGEVRSAEDSQLTLRGWALDWDRQQRFGMARAAREAAEALSRLNHECAAERERREAVEGELARVTAERDAAINVGDMNATSGAFWAERGRQAEARALTAEAALAKAVEAARAEGTQIMALQADLARYEAAAPLSARETAEYLEIERRLNALRARANGESP